MEQGHTVLFSKEYTCFSPSAQGVRLGACRDSKEFALFPKISFSKFSTGNKFLCRLCILDIIMGMFLFFALS